jgi:hypothetical protein
MTVNHSPMLFFVSVDICRKRMESGDSILLSHLDMFPENHTHHLITLLDHEEFCGC